MEDILKNNIIQFLPIKDIISLANVNKYFYNLCFDENVWYKLIVRDFGDIHIFKTNYYETYILCLKLNKLMRSLDSNYYINTINKLYLCTEYIMGCGGGFNCKLPSDIGVLCNLQKFEAKYHMHDFKIPQEIGNLYNLTELCFEYCSIKTIPTTIGNLYNLKKCYFGKCDLIYIPTEFGKLYNLQILWLYGNYIKYLPTELGNLYNLRELSVYTNPGIVLPTELSRIPNLICT